MASNGNWQFKLAQWMMGCYGFDAFSRGLLVASIVLVVINFLVRSTILSLLATFFMLLSIVRAFSRNHAARSKENQMYESLMVKPRAWWARMNAQADDRRRRAQQREAAKAGVGDDCKAKGARRSKPARKATDREQAERAAREVRFAEAARYAREKKARERAEAQNQAGAGRAAADQRAAEGQRAAEYEFFICEECGQRLTVPKGKGKLKVTCPKCGHVTMRES